ncbi:MAG: molybdopterin-dependent oxidoreductase [Terriglobia bacterium]
MSGEQFPASGLSRRKFLHRLAATSVLGAGMGYGASFAFGLEDPNLAGRPLVRYPEKTDLILLTSRPPQLETPMKYFDRAITPNEAFFVRYHIYPPTSVDLATWRLKISGLVQKPLELSMQDLQTQFEPQRVVAVNQCSGNSRGRFAPRVFGGQWGDGAMGCAEWIGVRLRDLLNAAGVKPGAADVVFNGLDQPAAPSVPDLQKSLTVGHIMDDPDILVAYRMNGTALPLLNGLPARVVVPGWYSTYWVKNLEEITVLDHQFDGFWMRKAYLIPDTPCGCVAPGSTPERMVPINRMRVRSFIASPENGARITFGRPTILKGIAFDGGYGIESVSVSTDGGSTWRLAELGTDHGKYAFREWTFKWTPAVRGKQRVMVRATNNVGESQATSALWNPGGYLRNVVEHVEYDVA